MSLNECARIYNFLEQQCIWNNRRLWARWESLSKASRDHIKNFILNQEAMKWSKSTQPIEGTELGKIVFPALGFFTPSRQSFAYPFEIPSFVRLPRDYSKLLLKASYFKCREQEASDHVSPAMCLICGKMLCSGMYCCKDSLSHIETAQIYGMCNRHSMTCGGGVGIFLQIRQGVCLIISDYAKIWRYTVPYVDLYGETDHGLKRGCPLFLNEQRLYALLKKYVLHDIADEVAHHIDLQQPAFLL